MPRKTFNTKEDFDSAYSIGVTYSSDSDSSRRLKVGYCREGMLRFCEYRAQKLMELFNWPKDIKLVIIGSGFGWLAECLENNYGLENIICTETSPYIHDFKDAENDDVEIAVQKLGLDFNKSRSLKIDKGKRSRCKAKILNEDLLTQQSINKVKNQLGSVDVALTEQVLSTLEDFEILDLSKAMHNLATTVIHLDTERQTEGRQDPDYNWKTIEEYKIMLPDDIIISANTWRVL